MSRIALIIEYDGTNYCGWQIQKNGVSVQQRLEEALEKALGMKTAVVGAGRTDARVHALGQVAHFDADTDIPADKFFYVLNTLLPDDIRIKKSFTAPEGFHARFSAKGKHYRYVIRNAREKGAVDRLYTMFVPVPLDVERMRQAAKQVEGEHDFAAFCAAGSDLKGTTVRTVYSVDVTKDGDYIMIDVKGSGFLYNMVRIIAGTLISVGKEKLSPQDVRNAIEAKDRTLAGATAQAQGLFLMEVYYEFFHNSY
ncbi:tRNA pseudouridine(38-40) synthase TruA [Christensenella tenuis]|uniref:tRNA pseudouridine synthase A n=1 Tax=Christensenella tenuis TaxID=2763033 RepID=A0ABR7EFQ3_9FIRM|nr:tRNA pseudouridine(38-40) synthase TruA [Christensenella tenuis]MBC5648610.1 tRNA pseudouridine(38-40) synthase TruA [Christensenella tenuis]